MGGGVAFAAGAAPPATARAHLDRGHRLYYRGEHESALKSYSSALALDPDCLEARLNGSVVLSELGRPREAAAWLDKAAALPGAGADAFDALGWARFGMADLRGARKAFQEALSRSPGHPQALLGMARVEMDSANPSEAVKLLDRAALAAPLDTLVSFYKGKAYALLKDPSQEAASLRGAVSADSFFVEAREALGLAQSKLRNFTEAWRQFSKAADADPRNKRFQSHRDQLKFAAPEPGRGGTTAASLADPVPPSTLGEGDVPVLRVGVGTDMAGRPVARAAVSWWVNGPFWVADAATGKNLVRGEAGQAWSARRVVHKKRSLIQVAGPGRGAGFKSRGAIVIRPDSASEGVVFLDFDACVDGERCALQPERRLRGALEIASYPAKRSLKLVNRIDLENYTHGVIAMEMPIGSPLESLKAQATLARSHALHIKTVTRRHRKEGYDLCDSQHCQVYGGLGAESARSLEIARATRGQIVTYNGKPGHVIYSSNCGGHTQSGSDLTGWGTLPYWQGVSDRQDSSPHPDSPWSLRLWLRSLPPAYCKPSNYVHASHFRWARVLSYKDLSEKLNRSRRIGRLMALRPGRRSPGGHLNSFKVIGTRGSFTITDEMALRSLLGVGSLRSTLFVMDTEYSVKPVGPGLPADGRARPRPPSGSALAGRDSVKPAGKGMQALIPTQVVLRGGGWGHGVGMCQSGAMGRAEAGQTFPEIIKAYFQGVELSRLPY